MTRVLVSLVAVSCSACYELPGKSSAPSAGFEPATPGLGNPGLIHRSPRARKPNEYKGFRTIAIERKWRNLGSI
jgi:hypothetical protein